MSNKSKHDDPVERFRTSTQEMLKPVRQNTLTIQIAVIFSVIFISTLFYFAFWTNKVEPEKEKENSVSKMVDEASYQEWLDQKYQEVAQRRSKYHELRLQYWQSFMQETELLLENSKSPWSYWKVRLHWEKYSEKNPDDIPGELLESAENLKDRFTKATKELERRFFDILVLRKDWEMIQKNDWINLDLQNASTLFPRFIKQFSKENLDQLVVLEVKEEHELLLRLSSEGEELQKQIMLLPKDWYVSQLLEVLRLEKPIEIQKDIYPLIKKEKKEKKGKKNASYIVYKGSEKLFFYLVSRYYFDKKWDQKKTFSRTEVLILGLWQKTFLTFSEEDRATVLSFEDVIMKLTEVLNG